MLDHSTNDQVVIRDAVAADAPAIADVHVDSWRTTYRGIVPDSVLDSLDKRDRAAMWLRAIDDAAGGQRVHVADVNGAVVGFVSAGPERTGGFPEFSGEIYAIYLSEEWRGRGLGARLFDAGVGTLLDQGRRSMMIWALSENPSCGFYRRLGGVPIATQIVTMGRKQLEETAFGWRNIRDVLIDDGPRG